MKQIIYLAFISLFLTACGGSSNNPTTLTGVFLDSPVINADYETQTQLGTTNLQGEYKYLTGEMVTFAIGDLKFPSVQAAATVTPLDIAGTRAITAKSVVNMIRLLQSLDKDGNPANGIEITDAAKKAAAQVSFSQSTLTFAINKDIVNLLSSGEQNTPTATLIAESSAIANFIIGLGRVTPRFTVDSTITEVVNPNPITGPEGPTSPDNPSYEVFCNRDSSTSSPIEDVGDKEKYSFDLITDNAQNRLVYYVDFEDGDSDTLIGSFTTNNGILSASLSDRTTYIPQDGYTAITTSDITLTYNVDSGAITGTEHSTQTNILNRNNVQITCETTWEFTGTRN